MREKKKKQNKNKKRRKRFPRVDKISSKKKKSSQERRSSRTYSHRKRPCHWRTSCQRGHRKPPQTIPNVHRRLPGAIQNHICDQTATPPNSKTTKKMAKGGLTKTDLRGWGSVPPKSVELERTHCITVLVGPRMSRSDRRLRRRREWLSKYKPLYGSLW